MKYPVNSTARIFYDQDGNKVTLIQLVRSDPEWAKNRIIDLEIALTVCKETFDFFRKVRGSDGSLSSAVKAVDIALKADDKPSGK